LLIADCRLLIETGVLASFKSAISNRQSEMIRYVDASES
jgi:hypothetical protein